MQDLSKHSHEYNKGSPSLEGASPRQIADFFKRLDGLRGPEIKDKKPAVVKKWQLFTKQGALKTFGKIDFSIILHRTAKFYLARDRESIKSSRLFREKIQHGLYAYLQEATARLNANTLDVRHASNIFWSLGKMQVLPTEDFTDAFFEFCIRKLKTHECPAQELSNIILSCAYLAIEPPPEFMALWSAEVQRLVEAKEFKLDQHYYNSYRALAVLDHLYSQNNSIYRSSALYLHEEIKDRFQGMLNKGGQSSVALASRWFDVKTPFTLPRESKGSARAEKELGRIFYQAATDGKANKHIAALEHDVDIAASHSGKAVFIELDGPNHFLFAFDDKGKLRKGNYNGSTMFNSALIAKSMPEDAILVRMPYTVYDMFKRRDCLKPNMMRGLLDHLVAHQGSGVHLPSGTAIEPLILTTRDPNHVLPIDKYQALELAA